MMPHWRITVVFAAIFLASLMQSSAGLENATFGQGLSLNVYLDNTGKALITGYAENVSGLEFLNTSQFRFENDTRQLYALTDGLTTKVGDLWTIRFDARGGFDDYHVTFYLPSDIRLGMINTSTGLGYLLSASNESLVADVQGYEVSNPAISIQYQQPLAAAGSAARRHSSRIFRQQWQYYHAACRGPSGDSPCPGNRHSATQERVGQKHFTNSRHEDKRPPDQI